MNHFKQSEISDLANQPSQIRNISILAHVDHGKTSLADSLISSNKIISPKLAGKIRYMDSRVDEQERCITMKSSSISLTYPLNNQNFLINLIDSPGHVDFSSEVASALRVCDGGLLVVDAAEGICPQTYTVMKQSWAEGIKLCLVLNKIDRLILELKMSPEDMYKRLSNLVVQANSVISQLFYQTRNRFDPEDVEDNYFFVPERGNVIFASALDRWAFTLREFAEIYSKKVEFPAKFLCSVMWGEFYYNPKTKKVMKKPFNDEVRPMIVQYVMRPLKRVYDTVMEGGSEEKVKSLVKGLEIELTARDYSGFSSNPRSTLQAVMSAWMPLEKAVLSAIIRKLPSPLDSQKFRISIIASSLQVTVPALYSDIISLNPDSITSGFVSKMIPIDPKTQIAKLPGDYQSHNDTLIAFTRIFSGTVTLNSPIYVIENKGDAFECVVESLYMLMGQYLIPIQKAYPGNIVGIGGLQSLILKTATISSIPTCCSFSPICSKSSPIVKVSVQPQRLYDMPSLINGLKLLDRSDNSVKVYMQDNGEHILVACGEVHLQRCIKDLEDTFAKVPITTSEPLVAFRETIVGSGKLVSEKTANKRCEIIATAYPLPGQLVEFLETHTETMKNVFAGRRFQRVEGRKEFISAFREQLNCCEPPLNDLISSHFVGFGPKRCGPNIIVYLSSHEVLDSDNILELAEVDCPSENSSTNTSKMSNYEIDIKETLLTGFDGAANAGPLCAEPLRGVCFVVHEMKLSENEEIKDIYGPFQGQVISSIQEVAKSAVTANSPRLSEGLYECTFTTTQEYIGKLYNVISKRRGKIVEEVLTEGTDLFVCKAYLPVIESFGFAEELRRMTSGAVIPQLIFSHWQTILEDPFYTRKTAEEMEEFGDQPILDNLPKVFINKVRKRKGMHTDEKLVVHGEKQRTLTKMR